MRSFVSVLLIGIVCGNDLKNELKRISMKHENEQRNIMNKMNDIRKMLDDELCNNNGFYYDDIDACYCFTCFIGDNCQTLQDNCTILDTNGNPKLFEYYWRNEGGNLLSQEMFYYRSPYQLGNVYINNVTDHDNGELLPYLVDKIKLIHNIFGNIYNVDTKNVVIGSGGTQLISAVEYACKQLYGPNKDMHVFARVPYYMGYSVGYVNMGVEGISISNKTDLDPSTVIEFVTIPNNPDNKWREPVYTNSACTIYDNVYLWPSLGNLTQIHGPINSNISLFSISKLSGHAGTRLGWALVNDPDLANKMNEYIAYQQKAVSIDAQFRTYSILNYLTVHDGENAHRLFNWIHKEMEQRWNEINDIFDPTKQNRFIQHSKYGGFYAWIQCLDSNDKQDCYAVFESVGINPEPGTSSGADNSFIRLELVVPYPVWNILVQRLRMLV